MGMYTELKLSVAFITEIPENVIKTLQFLSNFRHDEDEIDFTTEHELFKTERWMMISTGSSCYFEEDSYFEFLQSGGIYYLHMRSNIKNYKNEYEKFLDFLSPWVQSEGEVGHYQYEEDEEASPIFAANGKLVINHFCGY
jgi:hypothetical protein